MNYLYKIDELLNALFPINRSITGDGNRKTLSLIKEFIPIEVKEYPSGQKVYDWVIPDEWNVKEAWIKDSNGNKIVDFTQSNLHLASYSTSQHNFLKLSELKPHLHYLEKMPDAIPYRTIYYENNWGFCLTYNDFLKHFNADEVYEVYIDSEHKKGSLTYGELIIPGRINEEILISTYLCHPSLANDNLSGVILTACLAKELLKRKNNYTYRIIFVPETIGAIAYCANNQKILSKIESGFVITNTGGPGMFGYKQSFDEKHQLNRIVENIFMEQSLKFKKYPFDPHGSDERQYSSQGFRINTVSITKDKYYEYDFYHTSLDNLDFVKAKYINESLNVYLKVMDQVDKNLVYKNMQPHCEVMLSKHGLYPDAGGSILPENKKITELDIILWLLFYCDGSLTLFDIALKIDVDMNLLYKIAEKLTNKQILTIKNIDKQY